MLDDKTIAACRDGLPAVLKHLYQTRVEILMTKADNLFTSEETEEMRKRLLAKSEVKPEVINELPPEAGDQDPPPAKVTKVWSRRPIIKRGRRRAEARRLYDLYIAGGNRLTLGALAEQENKSESWISNLFSQYEYPTIMGRRR